LTEVQADSLLEEIIELKLELNQCEACLDSWRQKILQAEKDMQLDFLTSKSILLNLIHKAKDELAMIEED
jgi:hypothetical protein